MQSLGFIFIETLSTSFVMKIVFEHQFHNAIKFFLILRDPKIAAMTSQRAKF